MKRVYICVEVGMESGKPHWHSSFFLPSSCVFPSFLSTVHIWNSLAAGEACWKITLDPWVYLLERAWERCLSRGSTEFNTLEMTLWLGLEKFRPSCVCESCLLSAVGLKTNTVVLWTLIPQQWAVLGGISLAAVTYWYACDSVYFGSVKVWKGHIAWIIPRFYFFGPWESSSESKATRKCGISSCEFWPVSFFSFSLERHPDWNLISTSWDYMWLRRQWVFFVPSARILAQMDTKRTLAEFPITHHDKNLQPWPAFHLPCASVWGNEMVKDSRAFPVWF